ncbi:MAG: hypothetical protein GX558_06755, partial [Clostridiales bacterium]|nr:hypothetical protein [Clostridiales bacterium]
MRIRYQDGRARVTGAALDVRLTLCDSAQAFHFVPSGAGYAGRCAGRDVRVEPAGGGFDIVAARGDLPFWR